MRLIVGITAWKRTLETSLGPESMQSLSAYYTDAVTAAGMTPLIFPSGQDPSEAARLVTLVDGVLVSGGDDVHPTSYGEEITFSTRTNLAADEFELAVIDAARSADVPLLAICRGLQILNVAFGGTLRQEVTSAGGIHELIDETTDSDDINARRHVVHFEPGSIIQGLYSSEEAKVNTLHHQGIATLADDLIVEAMTDDGLVEAARYSGDWWALGVQWHPERMSGEHHNLFNVFRDVMANR